MSVNTILKCIEVWRKPICYGLQWSEIAISSAESIFSFTKVSIDSGEDCQFSPYVLLHRETYIYHFVGRQAWPLLSHLLGRRKRGAGSSLTRKPPLPPLQAAVFNSHVTPPGLAESIKLITLLCLSPGLGSPSSALSGLPSLQPFLCYLLISFVMSFRSPMCWYKKEKLFFFLSKFIIFSFLKPKEQIWKFFICNDISFCVLEYPQAWVWIRSVPYEAAVDCPQVYLSWKSEVSSCESNQIMEHTSCQRGERKRMK